MIKIKQNKKTFFVLKITVLISIFILVIFGFQLFKKNKVSQPQALLNQSCNDDLHKAIDPVLESASSLGIRVVGLTNPREVYRLTPGDIHNGQIIVLNQGRIEIVGRRGSQITSLAGDIWLLNESVLYINKADLDIPQSFVGQYNLFALDNSRVEIINSKISTGTLYSFMPHMQFFCGQSQGKIKNVDSNGFEVSLSDNSQFSMENMPLGKGLYELNLFGANNQVNLKNAGAGVYFTITSKIEKPIKLVSDFSNLQTRSEEVKTIYGTQKINFENSWVFHGIWATPGAEFTLIDSWVPLFLTYPNSGYLKNLKPCDPLSCPSVLDLSGIKVNLLNTTIPIFNVYTADSTESLIIEDSLIGEHGCASGICLLNRTTVDGSGGTLTTAGTAKLYAEESTITTEISSGGTSTINLLSSKVVPGKDHKPLIQANEDSLIILENVELDSAVDILFTGNGAVAEAFISKPEFSGTSVLIKGTARITSDQINPKAFDSFLLFATKVGDSSRLIINEGRQSIHNNVLGIWDISKVSPGDYEIHLEVKDSSGEVIAKTRQGVSIATV